MWLLWNLQNLDLSVYAISFIGWRYFTTTPLKSVLVHSCRNIISKCSMGCSQKILLVPFVYFHVFVTYVIPFLPRCTISQGHVCFNVFIHKCLLVLVYGWARLRGSHKITMPFKHNFSRDIHYILKSFSMIQHSNSSFSPSASTITFVSMLIYSLKVFRSSYGESHWGLPPS